VVREGDATQTAAETGPAVALTGLGELGRRVVRRCGDAGVPISVIDADPDALAGLRGPGLAVVRGDPAEPEVLRAAGIADAKMIVVTNPGLAEKMRICIAARQVNPRIAIVATSGSGAERAWLHEFGAAFVCDAIDEMTESLVRTVRGGL
jgi:CPA2 family monovalent cation:H+ antiporter-2